MEDGLKAAMGRQEKAISTPSVASPAQGQTRCGRIRRVPLARPAGAEGILRKAETEEPRILFLNPKPNKAPDGTM